MTKNLREILLPKFAPWLKSKFFYQDMAAFSFGWRNVRKGFLINAVLFVMNINYFYQKPFMSHPYSSSTWH